MCQSLRYCIYVSRRAQMRDHVVIRSIKMHFLAMTFIIVTIIVFFGFIFLLNGFDIFVGNKSLWNSNFIFRMFW